MQIKAGGDREANVGAAVSAIEDAAKGGAQLVVLPEVFAWRGRQADEPKMAESLPGPTTDAVSDAAARCRVHVVAGSILETRPEGGCYNTSILFGPAGETLASYRKIHLFNVDIPGKVTIDESRTRTAGSEVVCADTELGKIGLTICYDLRFPELYRALVDEGAEIVVMPAAFTAPTGAAHWHALIRARAIENQTYFIAANQFGPNPDGFSDYGHSLIADPWGEVLAEAGDDGPTHATADLSADRLSEVRRNLPCLGHRRLER